MDYIINGKVIVSQDGMRTIGTLETEIVLTPIPVRLLIFLIEHNNIAMTRDEILYAVWTSFGLVPSGTSLSQHISKLRKCFREFGIDETIIKTVPQKGIVFSASVEKVSHRLPERVHSENKKPFLMKWYLLILLLSITVGIILYHVYYSMNTHSYGDQNYTEWYSLGRLHSCEILTPNKNMTKEVNDYYLKQSGDFIISHKIICDSTDELLVDLGPDGPPVNQELAGDRKFFSFCQESSSEYQCNNFYYSVGATQ